MTCFTRPALFLLVLMLLLASTSFSTTTDSVDDSSTSTQSNLSIRDQCRLFPTWSGPNDVSYLLCSQATIYYPHNYQLFNGSSWEFPLKDLRWLHKLQNCMQNNQDERMREYRQEMQESYPGKDFWTAFLQEYPLHEPSVDFEYPSLDVLQQQHADGADFVPPVAIVVNHALHQREADTLQDVKQCLSKHYPHLVENRPFGAQYDNGGNNCVFLGAFLQWLAPGVAAQIRSAGHAAWLRGNWGSYAPPDANMHPFGYLSPLTAGIRTSGHLSYDGWEALGPHKDNDSLYTVLVMLSDPRDYDGGELYLKVDRSGHYQTNDHQRNFDEAHPPMIAKPSKYSAVVFMADENTHQVMDIKGGDRQTIGTELWEYGDAPFGIMRPSPQMWRNFQGSGDWWRFEG